MGHDVTALIGSADSLCELSDLFGSPEPTELAPGLFIVPLDETRLDLLSDDAAPTYEGFTHLNAALEAALLAKVGSADVLYVETQYFGGAGCQGAALLTGGRVDWREIAVTRREPAGRLSWFRRAFRSGEVSKPQQPSRTPINQGLSALGVRPGADRDEFDSVGLGRFRSLSDLGVPEQD